MSEKLYNSEDIKFMENTRISLNKSRIKELILFIKNSNFKKIGIANCLSMQEYADKIIKILKEENLEIFTANCKINKLENNKLFNDNSSGLSCDPAFQADFFNRNNTDLNINIGLCVGHGIMFNKYSKAPVTTLIVKDFLTNHKVIENFTN